MVRGYSPWGSSPFPTGDMGAHRRQRGRRLVIDYRKVNKHVQRARYRLRKAEDVKAALVGSAYISALDAVTGFNQVRNTRRAMEVLAVEYEGTYLPVGLTMGPVNGPEDFCYVVDRLLAMPRRDRRRFLKEWWPYADDLFVRSGR
eukprot:854231-Lingulodinium_polyedra.AAC.1